MNNCPKCEGSFCYQDRDMNVCPECGHEWMAADLPEECHQVKDSNGNVLASGDTVSVIRDLKVKGASSVIKVGTKVKSIRVLEPDYIVDGHEIDCKIDGFGAIKLKGSVVRKV
jgi:protein PhnA